MSTEDTTSAHATPPELPLNGTRVVDLTNNIAAPFGAAILADLGAEVVHVEPMSGDDSRRMAPVDGAASAYFHVVNRNKSGAVADLRSPLGLAYVNSLLADCDVFVTNLRPPTLLDLGLDAATLAERHPGLIHASLTAYGETGPDLLRPGYDAVLQARTGVASVTGEAHGPPVRVGVSILDVGAGTWLALGVLAALLRRERTGLGGSVGTSLYETGASWVSYHVVAHEVTGATSARHGSGHPAFAPYGIYTTGDGDICIGIGGDRMFARMCEGLGAPGLLLDPRFGTNSERVRHDTELRRELVALLSAHSAQEWTDRLCKAGVPVDRVALPEDLIDDPQAQAINLMVDLDPSRPGSLKSPGLPLRFEGRRPGVRRGAPVAGFTVESQAD